MRRLIETLMVETSRQLGRNLKVNIEMNQNKQHFEEFLGYQKFDASINLNGFSIASSAICGKFSIEVLMKRVQYKVSD